MEEDKLGSVSQREVDYPFKTSAHVCGPSCTHPRSSGINLPLVAGPRRAFDWCGCPLGALLCSILDSATRSEILPENMTSDGQKVSLRSVTACFSGSCESYVRPNLPPSMSRPGFRRDASVYGHTTRPMHDNGYTPLTSLHEFLLHITVVKI